MKIMEIVPKVNGGRPPLQDWRGESPPKGYAEVVCDTTVFYEFRGFVDCEFDDNKCIAMTGNQEALDAYLAEHPDKPEPEPGEYVSDSEALSIIMGEVATNA